MNTKAKKNIITFLIIFLFHLFFIGSINAADDKIEDEELPAIDPFAGSSGTSSQDSSPESDEPKVSSSIINNMKLVGIISGEHEKIAVLAMPDGRAFKFGENEFISNNIQLVDIYNDLIIVRVDSENEFEVYMNSKIKPREGN